MDVMLILALVALVLWALSFWKVPLQASVFVVIVMELLKGRL